MEDAILVDSESSIDSNKLQVLRKVKCFITLHSVPTKNQEPTKLQNPSTTVFIGSSEKDTVSSQPKMGSPIRQDLTVQQKSEMIFLPSTMFSTVSDQSGELDDQVEENRLFEEEHQNLPPKLALTKSLRKSLKLSDNAKRKASCPIHSPPPPN